MGRQRRGGSQDGWRSKLYAVFFELADLNRQFEKQWTQLQKECSEKLKSTRSPQRRNEVVSRFNQEATQLIQWVEQKLIDTNERYKPVPHNPLAYSYFTLDSPISDSEGLRQYLHFHRHGESLQASERKDAQGDIGSWDKVARTEKDFRILAFGKGKIQPFQEDIVHRQLLQLVVSYESERLTAEELAQCFDKYCACDKENHEPDTLRKMRVRFERDLKAK